MKQGLENKSAQNLEHNREEADGLVVSLQDSHGPQKFSTRESAYSKEVQKTAAKISKEVLGLYGAQLAKLSYNELHAIYPRMLSLISPASNLVHFTKTEQAFEFAPRCVAREFGVSLNSCQALAKLLKTTALLAQGHSSRIARSKDQKNAYCFALRMAIFCPQYEEKLTLLNSVSQTYSAEARTREEELPDQAELLAASLEQIEKNLNLPLLALARSVSFDQCRSGTPGLGDFEFDFEAKTIPEVPLAQQLDSLHLDMIESVIAKAAGVKLYEGDHFGRFILSLVAKKDATTWTSSIKKYAEKNEICPVRIACALELSVSLIVGRDEKLPGLVVKPQASSTEDRRLTNRKVQLNEAGCKIGTWVIARTGAFFDQNDWDEFTAVHRRVLDTLQVAPRGHSTSTVESALSLAPFCLNHEFGIAYSKAAAIINSFRYSAVLALQHPLALYEIEATESYSLVLKIACSASNFEQRCELAEELRPKRYPLTAWELAYAAETTAVAIGVIEKHINLPISGINLSGYRRKRSTSNNDKQGRIFLSLPEIRGSIKQVERDSLRDNPLGAKKIACLAAGINKPKVKLLDPLFSFLHGATYTEERSIEVSLLACANDLGTDPRKVAIAMQLYYLLENGAVQTGFSPRFEDQIVDFSEQEPFLDPKLESYRHTTLAQSLPPTTSSQSDAEKRIATEELDPRVDRSNGEVEMIPSAENGERPQRIEIPLEWFYERTREPMHTLAAFRLLSSKGLSTRDILSLQHLSLADSAELTISYNLQDENDDLRILVPAYARELTWSHRWGFFDFSDLDRHELLVPMLLDQVGYHTSLDHLVELGFAENADTPRCSALKANRAVNLIGFHLEESLGTELPRELRSDWLLFDSLAHTILNRPVVSSLEKHSYIDEIGSTIHSFTAQLEFNPTLRGHPAVSDFLAPWFFDYIGQAITSFRNVRSKAAQDPYSLTLKGSGKHRQVVLKREGETLLSTKFSDLVDLAKLYRLGPQGLGPYEIYDQERIDEASH